MNLFGKEKDKKKSYVAQKPDTITLGYWILLGSLFIYFMMRFLTNKVFALPFLIMVPTFIGVFAIFFLLPIRAINFFVTEIVLRVRLFHMKKNIPQETVVVIGKSEFRKPSFWFAPNYDTDLLLIIKYLKLLNKPFSVYYEVDENTLDDIMKNKKIKNVYLVGHGRRHGFSIDKNTVVDYCRYNSPEFKKDFVYQIHCNHGSGKSLVEYVVTKNNQKECLPEQGYMSNITINQMFIDKIIKLNNYSKFKAFLFNIWYNVLAAMIFLIVFIVWGFIFWWVIIK
jgi:hypothetical protein